jgi:hypothetical protein
MFYFYTILLPLVILLLNYFVEGKPNTKRKIISYFFKSFLFLIIYTLLIYFLETLILVGHFTLYYFF